MATLLTPETTEMSPVVSLMIEFLTLSSMVVSLSILIAFSALIDAEVARIRLEDDVVLRLLLQRLADLLLTHTATVRQARWIFLFGARSRAGRAHVLFEGHARASS